MKVAIFLNTYAKMQDYNLADINLLDYTTVAIVSAKELSLFQNSYNEFFNEIFSANELNIEETKKIIIKLFDKHHLSPDETRLICLSEDNLLVAGELREYFNITGMKHAQSELFRNKVKMKAAIQSPNIRTPQYVDLMAINYNNSEEFFNTLVDSLGNKFVIKPKSEFGGNGVKVINNYSDFVVSINEIINEINLYEAETFIEGDLYHIDSVYVDGKPVFQTCCKYSYPNFDFQLGKPSLSIPIPDTYEIVSKAKKLVDDVLFALDYKNGTSHLEFFVNNNQDPVFLEVAARTPGANTTPIYEKMFGFNMLNADLHINLGIKVETPSHNGKYCIRGIFPKRKCTVTKLNTPNVIGKSEIQWKIKEGDVLEKCTSLRDIAAKILVVNDNYDSACLDFNYLSTFDVIG